MVPTSETTRSRSPPPNPQYPKRTPHTSRIAAPKVKSQPEDGPHIGPKHVVVVLVYYWVKYSCVRLYCVIQKNSLLAKVIAFFGHDMKE